MEKPPPAETPLADYPREASAIPDPPKTYRRDGSVSTYVVLISGIGLLMSAPYALGLGSGRGRLGAVLLALLMGLRVVGGFGLQLSRRWACYLVLLSSAAYVALVGPGIVRKPGSVILVLSLLASLYFAVYCFTRLAGLEGPRPR